MPDMHYAKHEKPEPPPPPPPPPSTWKKFLNWWNPLSLEAKVGLASLVFVVLTFIAAALVVPEVRVFLGLEKPKEQGTDHPVPSPELEGKPPDAPGPDEPTLPKPRIKYVPLPNSAPLKTPETLVTSIPTGEDKPKTVEINGEMVPILTQAQVDELLTYRSKYTVMSPGKVDLWLAIGKDGSVQSVESASGNAVVSDAFKNYVKGWRFKPFVQNGEEVAVQAVIQLDGQKTDKMVAKP
jgi:hypothetical protein